MKSTILKDAPVTNFLTQTGIFSSSDAVSKVIGFLRDTNSYEAFVQERERTAILTIRDILNVKDITTTKLSTLMHYVPRLTLKSVIRDAATIMFRYKIRSLPVYQNSRFRGVVTAQAILKELMGSDHNEKIGGLMTPSPICVDSGDEVAKARRIMLKRKIDQLPVIKQGRLQGVVTSSSIVFNLIPYADRTVAGGWRSSRFSTPVEDFEPEVATTNLITDTLNGVYENMSKMGTQYSVILNLDEVHGIITLRDFMRMLVEPERNDSIPMYIVGLPEDPFEAEATREKFSRVVSFLRKKVPDMMEARAVIKAGKTKAARTRYEVQVSVTTARNRYNYTGVGYELPDVFDEIDQWSKKLLGKTSSTGRRRVRADPGTIT
ncbi:MAG: CBS domain-containing protein [Nitrososphaerales archaeon]